MEIITQGNNLVQGIAHVPNGGRNASIESVVCEHHGGNRGLPEIVRDITLEIAVIHEDRIQSGLREQLPR